MHKAEEGWDSAAPELEPPFMGHKQPELDPPFTGHRPEISLARKWGFKFWEISLESETALSSSEKMSNSQGLLPTGHAATSQGGWGVTPTVQAN